MSEYGGLYRVACLVAKPLSVLPVSVKKRLVTPLSALLLLLLLPGMVLGGFFEAVTTKEI